MLTKTAKLLTGGGLGDAAMSFAKLQSKDMPEDFKDNYFLTHAETHPHLLDAINTFYSLQEVPHIVEKIDNWGWLQENRKYYDAWVGTAWHKHNDEEDSWEIEPFPFIKYDYIPNVDILICPSSGREMTRSIYFNDIKGWAKKHVNGRSLSFAGKLDPGVSKLIDRDIECQNFINKTSLKEYIDLICSCKVLIAPGGFSCYLAGMAKKKVFARSEGLPSLNRFHPEWDYQYIDNIYEVIL